MDIKPYTNTIRNLLKSGRQFIIPRFQREYSWEKKNYKEFLDDMLSNLIIENCEICPSQYFLGTMLFIGDLSDGTSNKIQVVDGQQRLTTITILFSVMAEILRKIKKPDLANKLFEYIMTQDDNGEPIRVLETKTSHPYFAFFIQKLDKGSEEIPSTEEENCIKEAYDYFLGELTEIKLKKQLCKHLQKEIVEKLSFVDIIKALRDQVLNTVFISISTSDNNQANKIFEIVNAKGKRLAYIDLIKNKIFESLPESEPADFAEIKWKELNEILSRNEIGLATFYRHYWISKYNKSSEKKLYDDFLKLNIYKTKQNSEEFLKDLINNAKYYVQIVNPKRENYNSRREYYWLPQSLKNINSWGVVQTRIALLSLFDIWERGLISMKNFRHAIQLIEEFHFAYTAVMSERANRLEGIYSKFAIRLRKCINQDDVNKIIKNELIDQLKGLYPTESDFVLNFANLTYTKETDPVNVKTRYVIYKLNCYFSGSEIFDDNGSIEHIIPEDKDEEELITQRIGNLILLEEGLNRDADKKTYKEKIKIYEKSNYVWVREFLSEYSEFTKNDIKSRDCKLANKYYEIFCKNLFQ